MYKFVDYIVIGESQQTFSGLTKPLFFLNNAQQFIQFQDKIIHLTIPAIGATNSWEVEHFQRNFLKNALKNCSDEDLVIIADTDEFINMDYLLREYRVVRPSIIEMPLYYYFLNLKTKVKWQLTLITPFSDIKDVNIGDRSKYLNLNPVILKGENQNLGWHFSYLFGYNVQLYLSKLKSFSHQEFNTPYFLNPQRIITCLNLKVDILERNFIYNTIDLVEELSPSLYDSMNETGLITKLTYQEPNFQFYLNFYNLKYFIKFIFKPQIKDWLKKRLFKRR